MKSFIINHQGDISGTKAVDGITIQGVCSFDSSIPLTHVGNFVYISVESVVPKTEDVGFELFRWEDTDNYTLDADVVTGSESPNGRPMVKIYFRGGSIG